MASPRLGIGADPLQGLGDPWWRNRQQHQDRPSQVQPPDEGNAWSNYGDYGGGQSYTQNYKQATRLESRVGDRTTVIIGGYPNNTDRA